MKLINLFKSKTGKMALSAMQAVGLSAAVGVAGIAAWQMMGSSSEPALNTVFSSSDDQEVVFVAGGTTGAYASGNYGAGGEVQSGLRAKMSHDMQLMQADAVRAGETDADSPAFVQQEQQIQAFKMDGASGGLGMGANAANELGMNMGGGLEGVQQQMAAMQAALAAQQEAAAAAGQAAAGNVAQAAAQAAAQGQNGGRWSMADGMARASGSNLNSTPLQAGTGREGGASASGTLGGAQIAGAAGARGPMETLQGSRRATSGFGRALRWDGGDGIDYVASLQKQSADITQNRDRSANEGTRIFMSGERLSGGIQLDGGTLTTGSASSSDFSSDDALSALGSAGTGVQEDVVTYEEARQQLADDIKDYRLKLAASCSALPLICQTWAWKLRNNAYDKVSEFEATWGESNYMQSDTRGNLADDARVVIKKIWNRGWGGIIGALTSMWNGEFGKEGDHVFGRESKQE